MGAGAGNDLGLQSLSRAEQLEKSRLCALTLLYPNGFQVKNQPNFVKERLKLFEILKKDHQLLLAIYEKKGNTSNVITVRVADGKTVEGEVWKTTPYQVAAEIR